MSDMAKAARAAMKAKAKSLTTANDPAEKVSSTTWTPPEPLNADVKTGLRPVSRRAFKTGGKVTGVKAKANMGKKARASGGKAITADSFINRNVKEANNERSGAKHVGGMKKGGRTKLKHGGTGPQQIKDIPITSPNHPINKDFSTKSLKDNKGNYITLDRAKELSTPMPPTMPPEIREMRENESANSRMKLGGRTKKEIGGPLSGASKMIQRSVEQAGVPSATMSFGKLQKGSISPARGLGLKKGGAAHDDVKQDKALIRKMVKPSARTGKDVGGPAKGYKGAMLQKEGKDYWTPQYMMEAKMGQKEADDPTYNKGQGPTRENAARMEYLRKQEDMKPSYMKKTERSSDEPPYASSKNPPYFPEKRGGRIKRAEGGRTTEENERTHVERYEKRGDAEYRKGGRTKKEGGGSSGMPKASDMEDVKRGLERSLAEKKMADASYEKMKEHLLDTYGQAAYSPVMFPNSKRKNGGRTKRADGGGMRSESTQMAKAKSDLRSAYDDAKPSYNPIKNIGDIVSGRAMEKGASLSNALDRSRSAEQETGGYKKGGRTKRATGGGVFSGPGYPGKVPGAVGGRTAHARGGKAGKGKTDINIVIAAGKPAGAGDMMPGGPTPPPPKPVPVPPPAAGGPPPAGMPMQMPPMPPQGGAGGPPMGGMPPMPRKAGGRTYRSYKDMDAGAGSGVGRLEKTEIAERAMHNKGGKVGHRNYRNYKDMDAGAGSGLGRLEKTEIARKKTGIQLA